MRTETKEVKTTKQVFIAMDGTEFADADECKIYEESAKCIILARLKDCIKKYEQKNCRYDQYLNDRKNDGYFVYNFLDTVLDESLCRSDYWIFEPKTKNDIDNFVQYLATQKFYYKNEEDKIKENESAEDYTKRQNVELYTNCYSIEQNKKYIIVINEECEYIGIINFEKLENCIKTVKKL